MTGIVNIDVGDVVKGVASIFDELITNDEEREKAKLALFTQKGAQAIAGLKTRLSAILAEAQSKDPWTSRARPSFMYVMYIMILTAIPMGILHAYNPHLASSIADGMRGWLAAIPPEMWALFGAGYLGYGHFRSKDKETILRAKEAPINTH